MPPAQPSPSAPGPLVVTVPDQQWLERLGPWPDGVKARVWDLSGPADLPDDDVARVGMVVLPYQRPDMVLESVADLPAVQVVQTMTAGYEGIAERLPARVALANASGVHDASTAELAVGLVLASQRGIDAAARDVTTRTWDPRVRSSLADRRVLVVGAGGVGTAVTRRLEPFEVSVTRVASTARLDDLSDRFGAVHGVDELLGLLPVHDVVVLACPLTEATRGLFDAQTLAAMPDGSLLVNVARGPVVVTDALLAELMAGRLRAAVDVVDPEPLPQDHPLWDAPGLVMTPHVGGATDAMVPRLRSLVHEQVRCLLAGRPVRHVVRAASPASPASPEVPSTARPGPQGAS